ncbi:MAG: restriction endonuclease subunit S, partial [Parcubacteria group bacterium]|nr:restriction endonuclease subunit S [Parcubacteria group bacterium]
LLPKYLYYFFLSFDLIQISKTANIPLINNPDIYSIQIPLPPLETQHQIVEKLDRQMQALEGVRLLKSEAEKRIEEILAGVWGELSLGNDNEK